MQWMGLNEIRESFLKFFESKEHMILESFPLIPKDDNSLLLINSGMAPMKKYFTGEVTPPKKRVTTCQKCIRTPDIERVGITARHGTFFEMLGNFSFADYFKREAIFWAWEYFTEVLKMPIDKLYISVFENDDEAYDIWTKEVGVKEDHMTRLGKEDNFWEHGSGPCGPCSEIYFDRGPEKGCGKPDCKVGCECDRFVEVWNLVFSQFNSDGNGTYTELENKNIDTGMGLERLACVLQSVDNLFLVDTVQNIMKSIESVVNVNYGDDNKKDISLRVITDHIRSTTFMVADGVLPSNEGRGYVLRRLLRRASRHARLLGYKDIFLYKICKIVIEENKKAYPELLEKEEYIVKIIKAEEENFQKTIDQGLSLLNSIIKDKDIKELSGDDAFLLNDTYGFPIDLTIEILKEKEIGVDIERFNELMAQQKKRSRDARKDAGADAWASDSVDLSDLSSTEFVGYTDYSADSKVLAIIKNGERVESVSEGDSCFIVLDKTPFYAESGGQISDTGIISSGDNLLIDVLSVSKDNNSVFIHSSKVNKGTLSVGDVVNSKINVQLREDTMRNHTAAHLLQAALQNVLGNHVKQAGQFVSPQSLRFDFNHFEAMTSEEIEKVENIINDIILKGIDVTSRELPIEEAKKIGAMALFGEKYGDVVRVVEAGDFSKEFCGGTHVDNTSKIGLFKITSEGSVASGVRRIEAFTGRGYINYSNNLLNQIIKTSEVLKINNPNELLQGANRISDQIRSYKDEIASMKSNAVNNEISNLVNNAEIINGIKVITARFENLEKDVIKKMIDQLRDKENDFIAVIASVNDTKITFACGCAKDTINKGYKAGEIVKKVSAITGGNGGGKPDFAMAGGKDVSKVDEALDFVKNII